MRKEWQRDVKESREEEIVIIITITPLFLYKALFLPFPRPLPFKKKKRKGKKKLFSLLFSRCLLSLSHFFKEGNMNKLFPFFQFLFLSPSLSSFPSRLYSISLSPYYFLGLLCFLGLSCWSTSYTYEEKESLQLCAQWSEAKKME